MSSNPSPVNRSATSSADRPTLEEVITEAKATGLDHEAAAAWHAEAEAVGWIRGGTPVTDWRAGLRAYRLRKAAHTATQKDTKPRAGLMSREIRETIHITRYGAITARGGYLHTQNALIASQRKPQPSNLGK